MGTHPIFESDFDCLTDNMKLNLLLLSSLEASSFISVEMDASLDHLIGVKIFQKLMNAAKEQNNSALKIDGMNQVLLMKFVRLAKQLLVLSICTSLIKRQAVMLLICLTMPVMLSLMNI